MSGRAAVKARGRGVGREGRVGLPEAGSACAWSSLGAAVRMFPGELRGCLKSQVTLASLLTMI